MEISTGYEEIEVIGTLHTLLSFIFFGNNIHKGGGAYEAETIKICEASGLYVSLRPYSQNAQVTIKLESLFDPIGSFFLGGGGLGYFVQTFQMNQFY